MEPGPDPGEPRVPRVSVLLVVRDAERFVGEAVESILSQTFGDFELLIYDDGSTDDSSEVLERAAGRDLRVQLFREEARGLTAWLRRGVEDARGEFIARMDADDRAHRERLARQVAFLDRHPECLAVGSDALLVDPARRPIRRLGVRTRHEEIDAELMRGRGDAMLHPSVTMRRADVLAVGSYRPEHRVSQCLDLFLRLAERGRLANLPEPLLEYRQHLSKVSGERKGEQRRTQDAILRDACERRGLALSALPSRPPVPERMPASDTWHRWASWAIDAGNLATARRYAWKLFGREPFSRRACKLGLRALLGMRLETARDLQRQLDGLLDSDALSPELDPAREAGPRSSDR
jgi:glycosyltransferase involved in cell wall biosynthesis